MTTKGRDIPLESDIPGDISQILSTENNNMDYVDLTENDEEHNEWLSNDDYHQMSITRSVVPIKSTVPKLTEMVEIKEPNVDPLELPTEDPLELPNDVELITQDPSDPVSKRLIECNESMLEQMPTLEKIDETSSDRPTNQKIIPEMPTLVPIYQNKKTDDNKMPIYYESRRSNKQTTRNKNKQTVVDDIITAISDDDDVRKEEKTLWLISEPSNLGYIEIKKCDDGEIYLKSPLNGTKVRFYEMGAVIEWIDK